MSKQLSYKMYYPFGMVMPGREHTGPENYRHGFNGKEKDDEVQGDGNTYDYGFRIYNPRLGRFLSVDPLFLSYPWYTPYQFTGNSPIYFVDLDGKERAPNNMGLQSEDFYSPVIKKETKISHIEWMLNQVSTALNAEFNSDYKKNLNDGNERGGIVAKTKTKRAAVTIEGGIVEYESVPYYKSQANVSEDPQGHMSIKYDLDESEVLLYSIHTHTGYAKKKFSSLGKNKEIHINKEGVPHSGGDLTVFYEKILRSAGENAPQASDINNTFGTIVEAGSKRFALVIIDKEKAKSFIDSKNGGKFFDEYTGIIMKHTAAAQLNVEALTKDLGKLFEKYGETGFKMFHTTDKKKTRYQEITK